MAEETPMSPISAVEPPKTNPLDKPATPATLKLSPVIRKPGTGATQSALRPGLKLPPKPGATQSALRPGLKLPTKPVIHKPGEAGAAAPLPKPIVGAPVASSAPVTPAAPAEPVPVAPVAAAPSPMAALKSVTQKLKGVTQQIPAQAVLKKTGIISDNATSEAQKEAAKHKTARISLSEAMGVAPVKSENAPMKTIRIKRPTEISGAPSESAPTLIKPAPSPTSTVTAEPLEDSASITQRKTLKISRPATGSLRPAGKFGIKRPGAATPAPAPAAAEEAETVATIAAIPDIADIPDMPAAAPVAVAQDESVPMWLGVLTTIVQIAACVAIAALAWMLFGDNSASPF